MAEASARDFTDLIVWQRAHAVVLALYRCTADFPKSEVYGLTSQMRRSAVSIPANTAEGFKRRGKSDKARFLNIAQGSLAELRYYLILSKDLQYLKYAELIDQLEEVSRLLNSYARKILASAR